VNPHYEFRQSRSSGIWVPSQKPPFGARLKPDHPLNQGLVGCWLFNEDGGNTAFDLSKNQNHGTLTGGAYWAIGEKSESVLSFDVDDYVDCGASTSSQPTTTGSVAVWFKSDLLNRNQVLVSDANYTIDRNGFTVSTYEYSFSRFELADAGGYQLYSGTRAMVANTWNFIVAVWDGTNGKLYLNAGIDTEYTQQHTPTNGVYNTRIGRDSGADVQGTKGEISSVSIYDRALSVDEIRHLYSDPYSRFALPSRAKYFYVAAVSDISISISESLAFAEALD